MKRMSLILAALMLFAALAGGVQTAAANPISDAFNGDDEDDDSLLPSADAIIAGAQGFADRVSDMVDRSDSPAADEAATDTADVFNENNETIQTYLNNRTTADTDYSTIAVTFELDNESETWYLVADVDGDDYTNLTMVEETDREVDETITLRDAAAKNADGELDRFVDDYAAEDRDVDDAYISRLGTRYGSLFGDDLVETSFEVTE